MRFLVIVKATKDSEAGVMPDEKLLAAMGNFNEELVQAGIMQAGEGLHPSSKGARVVFNGAKPRDIERSEQLVMKGQMVGDKFHCTSIQMKCPSKYKKESRVVGS